MTKKIRFSTLSVILIVVFGIFYTSCKKEETEPLVATSLGLVSGSDQTAQVETTLANSIVVVVKDQNGNAFPGATVNFELTEGSVILATSTTDANGNISATWTLGATAGIQTLTVTAYREDGTTALIASPIKVITTAEPLVATSIELVSGNSQTATAETALTNPIVVLVKDQNGDVFAGTNVSFAVTEGAVSSASVTTDASGNASVTWTLGTTAGTQTLTVTGFKADGTTALTGSPISVTGTTIPLAVGDFAKGGVVFYLFVDGDNGYVAGEQHGLVCVVSDESEQIVWGCYGKDITGIPNQIVEVTAESEDVDGMAYSNAIVSECTGTHAASICRAKTGDYSDWYLPTLRELKIIYTNRAMINTTAVANGGTALSESSSIPYGNYWSSTEYASNGAWNYSFYFGGSTNTSKYTTYRVRAVRAF